MAVTLQSSELETLVSELASRAQASAAKHARAPREAVPDASGESLSYRGADTDRYTAYFMFFYTL